MRNRASAVEMLLSRPVGGQQGKSKGRQRSGKISAVPAAFRGAGGRRSATGRTCTLGELGPPGLELDLALPTLGASLSHVGRELTQHLQAFWPVVLWSRVTWRNMSGEWEPQKHPSPQTCGLPCGLTVNAALLGAPRSCVITLFSVRDVLQELVGWQRGKYRQVSEHSPVDALASSLGGTVARQRSPQNRLSDQSGLYAQHSWCVHLRKDKACLADRPIRAWTLGLLGVEPNKNVADRSGYLGLSILQN